MDMISQPIPPSTGPTTQPESPGCLTMMLKVMAVVLALAFIACFPLTVGALTLERILFNVGTYKDALRSTDAYSITLRAFSESLYEDAQKDADPGSAFDNMTADEIEKVMAIIIPPEWMQKQAESALDQAFNWLDSDQSKLVVRLEMTELRERLRGEEGEQALRTVFSSWPDCSQQEAALWANPNQLTGGAHLPPCKPPQETLDRMMPNMLKGLRGAADDLKDFESDPYPGPGVEDPRPVIRLWRNVMFFSPLCPAGLLIVIAALAARSAPGLLRWWGAPLLVGGLLGVVLAASIFPIQSAFTDAIRKGMTESQTQDSAPPEITDLVVQLFAYPFQQAALWIGVESGAVMFGGLLMTGLGFLMDRQRRIEGSPAGY